MQSWKINSDEDDRLQGLSADSQIIYLRGLRRYMDFKTGIVGDSRNSSLTHQSLKRLIEFVPESKSRATPKRVNENITTHYIRARLSELERAGLIERKEKENKFDSFVFFLPLASIGDDRLNFEPQMNRKGKSGFEPQGKEKKIRNKTKTCDNNKSVEPTFEPQAETILNRNISGIRDISITSVIDICDKNQIPPDLASVQRYCELNNIDIDPVKFWNLNESKGWFLSSGTKMKNWQASIAYWASNEWSRKKGKFKMGTRDIYADF